MIPLDMSAPAILCRTIHVPKAPRSGKPRGGVAVAHGSFLIMAHGYLAQPLANRPAFWITSGRRNVMPAEIEETMRRWNDGSSGAGDAGRRGASTR